MRIQALLIMLTLFALTGCVQLPQPVSPTEAPRPAMTMADAVHLHEVLRTTMKTADRKRSQGLADDVLTGTDLAGQVATYDKHELYGLDVDHPTQGIKILGVYSSAAFTFPQRAVIVSTQKPTKDAKDQRLLEVWTRSDVVSPWLRDSSATVEAKELPSLRKVDDLGTFISRGRVGGLRTDSMKPLADAFDRPSRQHTFKPDDFLSIWRDWSKDDIKELSNSNISMLFTGGRNPTVIATDDGGALILGRVSVSQTAQVKKPGSGEYIYWPKGYMRRKFPGHYQMTVDSYLMTALIVVPPTGKAELKSFTYWWVGTSAFE